MTLNVQLVPESDGGSSASIPALPGCHSQGETRAEAMASIREAAELWFETTVANAREDVRQARGKVG
jgi:predicted RNase H-like HicB family nuclease